MVRQVGEYEMDVVQPGTAIDSMAATVRALRNRPRGASVARLVDTLDSVRRVAERQGVRAVAPVVQALDTALARGERGPLIDGLLSLLEDAVRDGGSREGYAAFAAASSVRLAR